MKLKDNIHILNKGLEDMVIVIDRQRKYSCQNCLLKHRLEKENNLSTDQSLIGMTHESMGQKILLKILIEAIDYLV